jgi:hypothetical protein
MPVQNISLTVSISYMMAEKYGVLLANIPGYALKNAAR